MIVRKSEIKDVGKIEYISSLESVEKWELCRGFNYRHCREIAQYGSVNASGKVFEQYVVDDLNDVVGFYSFYIYNTYKQNCCYIGFAFDPKIWGTPITKDSHIKLREIIYEKHGVNWFFAETFNSNIRCKKYLGKLGYQGKPIDLEDVLINSWHAKRLVISRLFQFCYVAPNQSLIGPRDGHI